MLADAARIVRSPTAKFWESRFTPRGGKRREMGLGSATGRNRTSLSQARIQARAVQAMVREGRDPLAERAAEKAKADFSAGGHHANKGEDRSRPMAAGAKRPPQSGGG
jgi:hypothetical protein